MNVIVSLVICRVAEIVSTPPLTCWLTLPDKPPVYAVVPDVMTGTVSVCPVRSVADSVAVLVVVGGGEGGVTGGLGGMTGGDGGVGVEPPLLWAANTLCNAGVFARAELPS